MDVFVTGGTGFVGRYVLRALRDAGHNIRALVRHGSKEKLPFLQGVEVIHGDTMDPESVRNGMEGCGAVINLVGIIREFPKLGITFERMHYQSTMNTIFVAQQCGINKFVQMSANGAEQHGVSAYQTTKWRAERIVQQSGMDWTIFRPSVIFGDPGGLFEFATELAKVIKHAPIMPVFGGGGFEMDPVWVCDVADCFVKALNTPAASHRTFHLGGGSPMKFSYIVQTIGKALGKRRTNTISIPFGLIKPVAAALGGFSFFPVTADQLKMLGQGNVCPEHEYEDVFGIKPWAFAYHNLNYLKG